MPLPSHSVPLAAKDLLVLRAGHYNAASHRLLEAARRTGRFDIVVVADRRRRHFEYAGFEHVPFNRSTVRALGLPVRGDMQWRCGDYAYYLAATVRPCFRYLWLVETDLRLSFDDVEDFFSQFDHSDMDFLASNFRPAPAGWSWLPHVAHLRPVAYACFFPLTRISQRACQHLLVQRRAQAHALANDESFSATVLVNDGFSCGELEDVAPDLYARPGFSVNYPVLERAYERMPAATRRVYHPVLTDRLYLKRLRRYHRFPRNKRLILEQACAAYGVAPRRVLRLASSAAQALAALILLAIVVVFENPNSAEALMQGLATILILGAVYMAWRRQSA